MRRLVVRALLKLLWLFGTCIALVHREDPRAMQRLARSMREVSEEAEVRTKRLETVYGGNFRPMERRLVAYLSDRDPLGQKSTEQLLGSFSAPAVYTPLADDILLAAREAKSADDVRRCVHDTLARFAQDTAWGPGSVAIDIGSAQSYDSIAADIWALRVGGL